MERRRSHWRDRNIPYEPPLGMIGSMDGVGSKRHSSEVYFECYQNMKGVHGFFGIFNFFKPELIVIDRELIEYVLQSKDVYDFGAYTEKVKSNEELFKPALKSVNLLCSFLGESCALKNEIDIYNLSRRFAIDFTLVAVFNIKSHKVFELDAKHFSHPKFGEVVLTLRRTLPAFFQMRDEFFTKTLKKVMEMNAFYDIGRLLPSDDLAVQSFIGEYETVASTVAFALYELAWNEGLQKELAEEVADFDMQFCRLEEYQLLEKVFTGESFCIY